MNLNLTDKIRIRLASWLIGKQNGGRLPLAIPNFSREFGLSDSGSANQTELLKSYHTWVYRAVRIIAENVAKQKLQLFVRRRNDEREEIFQHPILDLFKQVNPIHTKYDLWELTMTYLELTGNAYWFKVRDRLGVTREIWPIRPDLMKPVPDPEQILLGYIYEWQGRKVKFEANEIVHLMYPNPMNTWVGMGTLQAAAYVFDADLFMRKYQVNTFANSARPDAVLETDQWGLDKDTIDRNREEWYKLYGGVQNARKVAILQAGVKYRQISMSPQELEFLSSVNASRNDILGMFGVPRSKAGVVEDVNRANAEAEDYTFNRDVILPKLCKLQEKLNQDFTVDFDPNLELEFENPVPEDKDFVLKERESNLKNFVVTINEVREMQGLPPVEWGDRPWGGFNLIQLGGGGGSQSAAAVGSGSQLAAAVGRRQLAVRNDIIFDDTFRLNAWKQFDMLLKSHQTRFEKSVKGLFNDQMREVIKNIEELKSFRKAYFKADESTVDFILFDPDAWAETFRDELDKHFLDAIIAGAKEGIQNIAADATFDASSPIVQNFLQEHEFQFSFNVNETTEQSLRQSLLDGIREDENLNGLIKRVEKVFENAQDVRAPRIARTEVNTSTNFGVHDSYRQSGMVESKNWLSQRDGNVRETHQLDFEVVKLSERFSNGLLYPGDPGGAVSEIVECRCTTLPVVEN